MARRLRRQLKKEREKTKAVIERLEYTSKKFMSAYAAAEEYHREVISLDDLLRQSATCIEELKAFTGANPSIKAEVDQVVTADLDVIEAKCGREYGNPRGYRREYTDQVRLWFAMISTKYFYIAELQQIPVLTAHYGE
jgi:hypothetical protein